VSNFQNNILVGQSRRLLSPELRRRTKSQLSGLWDKELCPYKKNFIPITKVKYHSSG
jgi:hypothetical protein